MIADEKQYLAAKTQLYQIEQLLECQHSLPKDAQISQELLSRMIAMQKMLEEELTNYDLRTRKIERQGDFIVTHSGKRFWIEDPHPEDIDIEDIAHALARICRFTGHSRKHASVAEHCVNMCDLAPDKYKLLLLLHDSSEFVLGDVNSILKKTIRQHTDMLEKIEKRILSIIYQKYNVYVDQEGESLLKEMDVRIRANELRDGLGFIYKSPPIDNLQIQFWDYEYAKAQFLDRFGRYYVDKKCV